MPHLGLGLHQAQRLEQHLRLELNQALDPDDWDPEPFRTEGEQSQVSQYEILAKLRDAIAREEFIDRDHFELEINRAIFGHPLEARIGNFGRSLQTLVQLYKSDEKQAQRILSLLSAQSDPERKDLPGTLAHAWENAAASTYFSQEAQAQSMLALIESLQQKKADSASALNVIAGAAQLPRQEHLVRRSTEKVKEYGNRDSRLILYTERVAMPLFKALRLRQEQLNPEQAQKMYSDIIEQLYMLDRELRIPTITEKIAQSITQQGLEATLQVTLPVPLQVTLASIGIDADVYERIKLLAADPAFAQGREIKRSLYRGFSSLEELSEGAEIVKHAAIHATDIKGLAKIVSAIELVHRDPEFAYPFHLTEENAILKDLRLQLVDRSVKRLQLDDATLEKYLARIEHDERFKKIGEVITTLAGYKHYQNSHQLSLLREITQAELENKFIHWRYSHDRAEEQLAVLGNNREAWQKSSTVSRIIGAPDALQAHITSLKDALPKLREAYKDYYKCEDRTESHDEIRERLAAHEAKLRGELSNKERKQFGHEASLLREQLSYLELLQGIENLHMDTYEQVLAQAERLSSRKSRSLLYEHAQWVKETLDQPAYREARKVQIAEIDDLETLLRMGELPVPHCQNWRVDSTLNQSLMSFVADANKKLYHVRDMHGNPISMSMVHLVDWDERPTLLVENVHGREWNTDYGIALLGSIADKAVALYKDTGKETRIATNNSRLLEAMNEFSRKYAVEIHSGVLESNPAPSKGTHEYWDCGVGLVSSGTSVSSDVHYIIFSREEQE